MKIVSLRDLPIIRKGYSKYRFYKILRTHRKIARVCNELIRKNNEDDQPVRIVPKVDIPGKKIIWQYWGQGESQVPEIVKICFESVDKNKGDYEVIRLSDENLSQYIDLPEVILRKERLGIMSKTFFSDLLRVSLLTKYGGVWLDATILLTGELPKDWLIDTSFFMYQRSATDVNRTFWENTYAYYWNWHPDFKVRVLNSIIVAEKGNSVVSILSNILIRWWMNNDDLPDYFFFQILFNELMKLYPELNCEIVSDCIPHLLQMKINNNLSMTLDEILRITTIHKCSYFSEDKMVDFKNCLHL